MMNKYELALQETKSVLDEWWLADDFDLALSREMIAKQVVERLIAKGVIQSTIENDLRDFRGDDYRTGPLEPGSHTVGGSKP
jgi:hypothetical protein